MGRMVRRMGLALVAATVLATVGAAPIAAEEQLTRKQYVSDLEKVCKSGAKRTQQAMKGARADVRANRLKVAARKFERAAKIFGGTVRTISARPRPPGDTARLTKWFTYLRKQESYLRQIAVQLRAGREIKAQRLLARFIHNGNLANNTTLAFEFDYCSFKFSRYG